MIKKITLVALLATYLGTPTIQANVQGQQALLTQNNGIETNGSTPVSKNEPHDIKATRHQSSLCESLMKVLMLACVDVAFRFYDRGSL